MWLRIFHLNWFNSVVFDNKALIKITFFCCIEFILISLHGLQELESLKSELEESIDTTAAATEMRTKRESELVTLKKSLEENEAAHEAAMAQFRQKSSQVVEELQEQLDSAKKVN